MSVFKKIANHPFWDKEPSVFGKGFFIIFVLLLINGGVQSADKAPALAIVFLIVMFIAALYSLHYLFQPMSKVETVCFFAALALPLFLSMILNADPFFDSFNRMNRQMSLRWGSYTKDIFYIVCQFLPGFFLVTYRKPTYRALSKSMILYVVVSAMLFPVYTIIILFYVCSVWGRCL